MAQVRGAARNKFRPEAVQAFEAVLYEAAARAFVVKEARRDGEAVGVRDKRVRLLVDAAEEILDAQQNRYVQQVHGLHGGSPVRRCQHLL